MGSLAAEATQALVGAHDQVAVDAAGLAVLLLLEAAERTALGAAVVEATRTFLSELSLGLLGFGLRSEQLLGAHGGAGNSLSHAAPTSSARTSRHLRSTFARVPVRG